MINGVTGSNSKKMTYNGGNNSNKPNGRHPSSYSGGHHGGPNHHHQHSNSSHQQQQQNVAMAAFMNQSAMAAALMNPYALANLRTSSGPHHQHLHQQSSHSYYGFPSFPSVIDPSIRSYYQQSSQNAQSQQAHAPKVLYSKALQGSLPTQSGPPGPPAPAGIPPPVLSSIALPGNNGSLLVGPNLYQTVGGRDRDGNHKGSGSHFGSPGGTNDRNMSGLNSGNIRGMGKSDGQPYLNHQNQPYQNSRMPSNNNNTSSSSPPATGSSSGNGPNSSVAASTNGSISCANAAVAANSTTPTMSSVSGANDRANNTSSGVATNGNGKSTPEGKSSLMSDHTDRSDYRGSISKTNLYIRGLTPNTTDKDLHALCSPYGTIISTKAILDKETNKCRGYGFVDFDNPLAAESAVKSLISQGVQAQMAKCSETSRHKFSLSKGSINEHDPTNLYIANLPMSMTEHDLEAMLTMYGPVVSTRILKDSNGTPRGVGFARMETKEKCDTIINLLNGKLLPGSKDTLLVKFADGGIKKKHYKHGDNRYRNDVDLQMNFDSTNLATNGVPTQLLPSPLGASAYQRAFSTTGSPYQNALQAANPWLHQGPPQYIMQPQMIPANMDPNTAAALQYSPIMHQLSAQMSHLQLGGVSGAGYMPGTAHAYGAQALYPQQLIQSMTLPGEQQESINPSNSVSSGSASGEEQQQQQATFQQQQQQMCYNQPQK